jgi:NAD-dependent SIR2 family protein deacetylase
MANIKLYAYFDIDTGNLLAFSNELRNEYEYKLEVTKEEYHRFVSGIEKFNDWVVCRTKNVDYEFELVQKEHQNILFKNNLFVKITNNSEVTPELIIHWDSFKKSWIFIITDEFRQRIYDETSNIRYKDVEFYITLANEPNMLIQHITINIDHLIQDKIVKLFVSEYELDIKKINIFIKNPGFSYGIQEWKEVNE